MEEGEDRREFISRIGTFFLLVGALIIVLFIASDMGQQTYFSYFFVGITVFAIGFIMKRVSAAKPKPSARFEALRKMQQKQREAKAKKEAPKNDPKNKK